jgi:hypothetical protein
VLDVLPNKALPLTRDSMLLKYRSSLILEC